MMSDDRLARIEDKLDRLADIALNHAVLEQKVFHLQTDVAQLEHKVVEIDGQVRLMALENTRFKDRQAFILKLLATAGVILLSVVFGVTL